MVEARGIEAATVVTHSEAADAGWRSAQFLGTEASFGPGPRLPSNGSAGPQPRLLLLRAAQADGGALLSSGQ